jgi:diguanylate cyclase (GGDEF)-like protein
LIPQERALPRDLERAARERFARSGVAAGRLLDSHLVAVRERFRAVSRTPEFRANLEAEHAPTLRYYAEKLAQEQGTALLAFLDRDARVIALAGDRGLLPEDLLSKIGRDSLEASADLVAGAGEAFALASVPLRNGRRAVGWLLAAERIDSDVLSFWSDLCGARVAFEPAGLKSSAPLQAVVHSIGELELRVSSSLEAEQRALGRARRDMLSWGAVALALAFGVSLLLARGLVRPIREIQEATGPIGRGELGIRLGIRRRDEIGAVALAFNGMLDRLEATLAELRTSQARLANAQRIGRLGSWHLQRDEGLVYPSEQCRRILGLTGDGPLPIEGLLARIHPEERERLQRVLDACLSDGTPFRISHRVLGPDDNERVVHSQGERTGSEGDWRFEATVQDVTEREHVEQQVRYLASHDPLTGLGNRRLFEEHLIIALGEARRSRSEVAVLVVGLDGCQLVNDTLGRSAGDAVLRSLADRLVESSLAECRTASGDTPGAAPAVVRLAGDEFGVLLSPFATPQVAGRLARRLLRQLTEPVELDGHEASMSASIGVATGPATDDDHESLLRKADTAMHHAKDLGRNNVQFFSEPMNAEMFKRLLLESKLRRAIEEKQFELHFQPKIEVATCRVTGLEALLRWRDPDLGQVSPAEFIPLAEETGLIGAIGDWVMRAAARQLHAWQTTELSGLRVSINLSRQEIGEGLAKRVERACSEAGVDPSQLDVEITETAVGRRGASVCGPLEQLRELGVSIALDDFGTGYSSLSLLRELPIDTVKIDRSFVVRMEQEADDAALLGTILSIACVLRLRVVVEGVETEGQLALLEEMGCDQVQGYLIGAPVRAEDLPHLLEEIEGRAALKRKAERGRGGGARRKGSSSKTSRLPATRRSRS